MKYVLTAGWEDGIADLTQCLARELSAGKKVMWLLSGGSNIPASVEVMDKISASLSKNLTVSLADERYGEVDYVNSNWNQLITAGFEPKKATLEPVLKANFSFDETLERYKRIITDGRNNNDIVIAQLGIGDDGHIAGILPGSPAATEVTDMVCGYQSQPYLRLTITFPGLREVDTAYAFAFGNTKQATLTNLQTKLLPTIEQPAQILKEIPAAFLYSDQIGETA